MKNYKGIRSFRDLRIWRIGMDLVEEVYGLTKGFPKEEIYRLTNQMQRAAISIPSNIAEGNCKKYRKEYLYYLSIAQGSLAELETQFEISVRLDYLTFEQANPIFEKTASLGRQIYGLQNALKKKEESLISDT